MKTIFEILKDHLNIPDEITVDDVDGTIISKVELINIYEAMEETVELCINEKLIR